LAEAGADVVATGRREKLVQEVSAEIEAVGRKSLSVAVDVLHRASVDQLRDAVVKYFGRVDILLNAAGKIDRMPTATLPEPEWEETFNVNVTGALRACQAFYEPLKASGRGRIINIVSLNSYVSLREVAAYAASKSALLSLTRSLAVEWSAEGINVNAIAPGVFRTDLNKDLLDSTDRGKELLMRTPMKRFGQTDELNGAAVLLASDAASFITGQCIIVDGGFLASGVNS
jgi:NAD(P)-dependent dehydrogenase (short-subunit alcohol dehydrogenase family)